MNTKKKLVKEIIRSLKEDWQDWTFNKFTANNTKTGIEIWIANIPILDLFVYNPTRISFAILDKIRIYKALDECRSLKLLSLNNCDVSTYTNLFNYMYQEHNVTLLQSDMNEIINIVKKNNIV